MKITKKISFAVISVIPVTVIYYFIYVLINKLFDSWCKKNYCFEFPPYADILAIYIAVVGLYFVIVSLDAWKKQDKYQTAKTNIIKLHTLQEKLHIYIVKLSNLNDQTTDSFINLQNVNTEKTQLYEQYETLRNKQKISELVDEIDHDINCKNKSLFQENFQDLIALAFKYLSNINNQIRQKNNNLIEKQNERIRQNEINKKIQDELIEKLPKGSRDSLKKINTMYNSLNFAKNNNIINMEQSDIDKIITQNSHIYDSFESKLTKLQKKLNDFIE